MTRAARGTREFARARTRPMTRRRAGGVLMADPTAGSASLWVLALAMVLWMSVASVVLVGVAVAARHRAAAAADLSALAAASAVQRAQLQDDPNSAEAACATARKIAAANNATVESCQVSGAVVDVATTVAIPTLAALRFLGLDSVSARARAGPT